MRTNEELIALLQTAATQEARAQVYGELYIGNKGIIARSCYRWARAKGVEMDDLMQEAYFMLAEAADAYAKKETSYTFLAFLSRSLDWGFIRYFCKQQHLTKEVCCLDAPIEGKDGGEDATMLDFIPDESHDTEEEACAKAYDEEVLRIFFDTIQDYPPPVKEVLHRVLFMGHSYKAIAEACGKSAERVRQLYKQGIKLLKQSDIRARLRESEERDNDLSLSYRLSGFKFWKESGLSSVELIAIKHEERAERAAALATREQRRAALYGNSKVFR